MVAATASDFHLLALAEYEAMQIERMRDNDPWDGPKGVARPKQLPPEGAWKVWMVMAGRGFGKTRTGAEWIRKRVQNGEAQRIVIAGPTAADIRDIMIQGESGLEAVCDRAGITMTYEPSKRRVTFPASGAVGILVSADEPKRFRGLQCDTFWADELASWRYDEAWDQLQFGHRLRITKDGTELQPRGIVTTTPRPIPIIKKLLKKENVKVERGSTFENADNLAEDFIKDVIDAYEGTTLGRQELYAEVLEDVEGALWNRALIDAYRVRTDVLPDLASIAVAIDPATTHGENSDETGLAVAGRSDSDDIYVLHISGGRWSPNDWANRALDLYERHEANEIVAESNQGGEMVKHTITTAARDRKMRIPKIRLIHASRGKRVRAEPVVAMYEQGRAHHVGQFAAAEDQMCTFPVGTDHDDQVDALVHAVTAVDLRKRRGFWGT